MTNIYTIQGIEYALMICGACGVTHLMPEELRRECEKKGPRKSWRCPNGHERVYQESEADTVRRDRDRLKQRLAEKDDEIASAHRATAAAKGQITKLRKRISAGVCPCCNRHFTNLERHMKSKHSDVDLSNVANIGKVE